MSDFITALLQWLNAHPYWAGIVTFIISASESIAVIGTIVPGTVMMTAVGTLAGAGVIPLWSILIWAILGAIAGDGISYWFGHHYKDRLHLIWPFRNHPNLLESGEKFFRKYGGMSVFIGRFIGPVRALVPLVAGMLGMKPLRFLLANVASAIGWAPAYMFPGILLGAASLELPPDIALHVIILLLGLLLVIVLSVWLIRKIFILVGSQTHLLLHRLWYRFEKSSSLHSFTQTSKHHPVLRSSEQLTLAFYLCLSVFAFILLISYVVFKGSPNIFINKASFYLFRSIHTPFLTNIMLSINFLGELKVIAPLIITLALWCFYKRQWWTGFHIIALGIVTIAAVEVIKHVVHSPRPWGVVVKPLGFSFPSGHTTLSACFYTGIMLLVVRALQLSKTFFVYFVTVCLLVSIGASRLYLGAHWFTDVLGGWLLAAILLLFISLSYNRKTEKNLSASGIIITALITLLLTYSLYFTTHFKTAQQKTTLLNWPSLSTTLESWWNQSSPNLPLFRINRLGMQSQMLNIQWVGNLDKIKEILLQNGWQIPPQRDWINVLQRLADVEDSDRLPLVTPLYLNQEPVLILGKHIAPKNKLIVLRLWHSNITLKDSPYPLWVGSIELVPRTYSWLFKHGEHYIPLTPALIFETRPKQYLIKEFQPKIHVKKNLTQTIILIKPLSL